MKRQATLLHLVLILLLAAALAVNTFIFPLPSLGTFAAAALILFFVGRSPYIFDPTSDIWDGGAYSSRYFGNWAQEVTSSRASREALSRFLREPSLGFLTRLGLRLSFFRAWIYVHAVPVVVLLAGALLVFDGYEMFFSGHGLVWAWPLPVGAVMGLLWGYSAGLYRLWQRANRPSE